MSRVKNGDLPIIDGQSFAGQTDNSLNQEFTRLARITNHHDIASLRLMQAVGQFVNDEVFIVMEIWLHRSTFDVEWLEDEESNRNNNGKSDQDDLDQFASKATDRSIKARQKIRTFLVRR